jgi:hypothetical protein
VVEAGGRREDRRPHLGRIAGREGAPARIAAVAVAESVEIGEQALGQASVRAGDAVTGDEELAGGEQRDGVERADSPLVGRVEGAERIDLVPEEFDPGGQRRRRREDIDDAAAPGELAAAGDLGDRDIAETEELAEEGVERATGADAKLERDVGQVVRPDRVLEECLDARDEDPRAATPPRGEGGDARRGLVGDELAPLVGERRPRLEGGDGIGRAEPGAELLRHAVADLRVAGDPAHSLAGAEHEGRGEVRLGPVRHRREPRVA